MKSAFVLLTVTALLCLSLPVFAQDSLGITCERRLYNAGGSFLDLTSVGDFTYIATTSASIAYVTNPQLHILNTSDPSRITEAGFALLPRGDPIDIESTDQFLYVAGTNTISFYSIENPRQPELMKIFESDDLNAISAIRIAHDELFLGTLNGDLKIFDISNPDTLRIIRYINVEMEIRDIKVVNDIVFLAGSKFKIVNVVDGHRPYVISEYNINCYDQAIHNDHCFLASGEGGVRVIDISNLERPIEHGYFEMNAQNLAFCGDYLFASFEWVEEPDGRGGYWNVPCLIVLDVSDPTRISRVCQVSSEYHIVGISGISMIYENDILFIGWGLETKTITNFDNPCIAGVYHHDYGCHCIEYFDGHVFTNVKNITCLDADVPNDPVELYSIDIHQYPVNFCISNNFLFTGGEYEPYIIVCDLSLEHPRAIDHLYLGYRDFVDVCAQDSIAFVATRPSENSGITIIDATNPYQLREINHIALNTEIFDVKVARSKVFLATRSDGIIIIDVSNLDELRELGRIDALDYVYEVEVVNNNLFVADGSLRIYDISDIDNIQIVSVFDFPGRAQTIECIDDLVFVGTSQRDTHDPPGGIYMLNISDLDSPELIGFCNTYGWPSDITLDLPYVYVAEYRHLAVYNCEQALKVEVKTQIYPIDFALLVYPNPFNSSTIISFSVPRPGEVYLSLFDTMGRKVQDFLYRSWMPAGKYQRLLELSDLTAGTYLIRLESKDKAVSRTITYLK